MCDVDKKSSKNNKGNQTVEKTYCDQWTLARPRLSITGTNTDERLFQNAETLTYLTEQTIGQGLLGCLDRKSMLNMYCDVAACSANELLKDIETMQELDVDI